MATRAVTAFTFNSGVVLYTWTGLANGDDGAPVQAPAFSEKCVHVKGTFGAGGTAKMQFTNDGATVSVFGVTSVCLCRSPDSVAISITAENGFTILENPLWLRPVITAGDGTTALTCLLVVKPGARMSV